MNNDQPITILGSAGWIGSALVADLQSKGRQVRGVNRDDFPLWLKDRDPQGVVIYAIGLTADFRQQPYGTVEAHVSLLSQVMQRPGINKLLFLSSTRVYARSAITNETAPLPCLSTDSSDIYNLSKLLGEALILQDSRPEFKVVRLSNVVGARQPSNTFVGALLEEARACGVVTIRQPPHTTKNYVALADVVRLLPMIAEYGQHRLYNLGSGVNTSHAEIASWLQRQGFSVQFSKDGMSRTSPTFKPLVIDRLLAEYPMPSDPFTQFTLNQVF